MSTELDSMKGCRIRAIFDRTDEIVVEGLLLTGRPEGAVILPMDTTSRLNYHILNGRSGEITGWPIYLQGAGCLTFVAVLGAVDLSLITDLTFTWWMEVVTSGTPIIQQVLACTTVAQVTAVVDDRKWSDFPPGS